MLRCSRVTLFNFIRVCFMNSLFYQEPHSRVNEEMKWKNPESKKHFVRKSFHSFDFWNSKIFSLVRILNIMAPFYIASMFYLQTQRRYSLRLNASLQLNIPRTIYLVGFQEQQKACRDRAFLVAVTAAALWIRLPCNIRDSQSIDIFKSRLKTVLLSIAFEV